ncbi:MAG TPA: HU family DNA-binding protein [Firmicutes bacterium]|uniref:HU family DNA-binding protein n=1 Tax=candidate division TA06 bacterium TaxID=2250710 RepID=A0A660S6W5_UNCT6|nr:HU family DNA-binding protein [candidate division WOR-3 bacterium]RKX65494.1 MAG: hypothetical protein DRP44_06210 [candidate division TA06 bacterium]HFD04991.1 HU family DNA-binding protein [Bacillota bacterium]
MNRQELIKAVAAETNLSNKKVKEVIDSMLDNIQKAVLKKEKVTFVGFGTFQAKWRKPRTAINPRTKEKMKVKGKFVPHFSAGSQFKVKAAKIKK